MSMHVDHATAIAKSLPNDAIHRHATDIAGTSMNISASKKNVPPSEYATDAWKVRPQRRPNTPTIRSVSNPPDRHATPPAANGAPDAMRSDVLSRCSTVS